MTALVTSWKGQYLLTPNASPFCVFPTHLWGLSSAPSKAWSCMLEQGRCYGK